MVVTGGLLATLSLIVSSFLDNLIAFTCVYGALLGMSFGMIYLPAMMSVNLYFESKRALASGLVMSGSCVGFFALAPVMDCAVRHFGLRVTIQAMSGFTGLSTLLGLALKSPPSSPDGDQKLTQRKSSVAKDYISSLKGPNNSLHPLRQISYFLQALYHKH